MMKKIVALLGFILFGVKVQAFNQADVQRVIDYKQLLQTIAPNDLTVEQKNLRNLNLDEAVLEDIDVSCADMSGTSARGVHIKKGFFLGTKLAGVDFSSTRRNQTVLEDCRFEECDLTNSFWNMVIFDKYRLANIDFTTIGYGKDVLFIKGRPDGTILSSVVLNLDNPDLLGILHLVSLFPQMFFTTSPIPKKPRYCNVDKLMPSVTFPSLQSNDAVECSICKEGFESDSLVGVPECGHVFCLACLQEWLKNTSKCPLCKKVIPRIRQMDKGGIDIGGFAVGAWSSVQTAKPLPRLRSGRTF